MVVRPELVIAKPAVRPSLDQLDIGASDPLQPPWPDAVLTIGRHLSRVALWIKEQSGGRTRIALLNAPKGRARAFDLVVLPPFYRNSGAPNILTIRMPLIGVAPERLAEAGAGFRGHVASLKRPLHVFLVGGDMGQRRLEPGFVRDALRRMTEGFAAEGSIFAATSRRTPPAVADVIAGSLRAQDRLYRWGSDKGENPYLGLLAEGDTFTVTADSLSMLIEVARLGKPLAIAEPPPLRGLAGVVQWSSDLLRPRDLRQALALLYQGGHAVPLGAPMHAPASPLPDDTERVAQRLRQLVGVKC